MNKHNLLDRKYIIRILSIILKSNEGKITNYQLAKKLDKNPSTIYPQLKYLEDKKIIYKEDVRESARNEKTYRISNDILGNMFLDFLERKNLIKNLSRFKNNLGIDMTLISTIAMKENYNKAIDITLKNIFEEVYKFFIKLSLAKNISQEYGFHYKKDEIEFKDFLKEIKIIARKYLEEIKKRKAEEEKQREEEVEMEKSIKKGLKKLN